MAPIKIISRQVYEAIRSFKAGTAPGPSGIRSEHLKEAKGRGEGRGAAALGALCRLVNTMAAGKVRKEVVPYLFGGNLFAIIKKTGGHRPVAVGDVLRRLTSKCIAYEVSGRAAQQLRPLQFGVGVRGGCEAVVHATRATLASETITHEQKWTLQVDLENGFNQSGREEMFKEVCQYLPDLGPWVESCYRQSSILNFGDGSVISTTGVHQGDPLGTLLFSLTLQPVLKKVQEVPGLEQNSWYLDDDMLVGTKEALVKAWDILVAEGAPQGFHLSREKSLVSCQGHDGNDKDPLRRGVTRVEGGGFKLLGAPVGTQDDKDLILEERLVGIQHLLDSLHLLVDPHMEYTLLCSCFSFPKFSFTL